MPGNMANEEKDPLFVMNSLADRQPHNNVDRYRSTESLEDHHSTTSSTESASGINSRKDHEFIPTRMKTISASKPAADPTQFTRIPSNPLLISAQKQLLKVEEVKKKKEVIKRGDDEPDWQSNLSSWKDRRRKQSEEALQRVAEVKALETDGDEAGQRQKLSIGKKLSSLLYTDGEDDWSDLGLEKAPPMSQPDGDTEINLQPEPEHSEKAKHKKRTSLPATIRENPEPVEAATDITELVKSANRMPGGGNDGYGEGVPVLNRKTSAPVMPYGSPRMSEEKEPPPVRRKSSELSSSMKSRLEAFTSKEDISGVKSRIVEPDNTFREKLQTFRKISEPQPEDSVPKGPKPPLSYKTLIGNSFTSSQQSNAVDHEDIEAADEDEDDDVDKLLDDALEESYRSVLEEEKEEQRKGSSKAPPTEKPPPPPSAEVEETAKNHLNLKQDDFIDKQEQEIIASLEKEEREHKKYMDTVNAMRNLSPTSSGSSEGSRMAPQPYGKKSISPTFRNVSPVNPVNQQQQQKKKSSSAYNQQHWLIQEAEQRRISEQQMRQYQQQQSPVYENSNYVGGMPMQQPHVPPPSQYTNHQRPAGTPANGISPSSAASTPTPVTSMMPPPPPRHLQQPSPNENMYANLGQHPPLPPNFQRDIPPGPPPPSNNMRGLPGPQVPPRNPPMGSADSSAGGGSSDRLLSVSGKKKCSHCKEELGRGAAMIIESLRLFYHLRCFRCVVCHVQLGNGSTGTDVRVRNNKLHCQNCYSNDEGLKFSKV